jgi:hypothetical protein
VNLQCNHDLAFAPLLPWERFSIEAVDVPVSLPLVTLEF